MNTDDSLWVVQKLVWIAKDISQSLKDKDYQLAEYLMLVLDKDIENVEKKLGIEGTTWSAM